MTARRHPAAPGGDPLSRMVATRRLQEVPPSTAQGRRRLARSRAHLASARSLAREDPEGAYASAYDAAQGRTVRPFDPLRRRRHEAEYPSRETPRVTGDDVIEDALRVEAILDLVDDHLSTTREDG